MPERSANKRIAVNTILLYIRMLAIMLVTLYTSRVVLAALGVEDYGIYDVVGGVVTIMGFVNSALSASTSRFLSFELGRGNQQQLNNTFSASLNLHYLAGFIVVLLGETVGLWFFYNKLNIPDVRMTAAFWVFQFSIVTTFFRFIQVPYSASLISHENMSVFAFVGLYDALARLGIAYLIKFTSNDRLIFYGFLLMLNTILIQLFYSSYTRRKYQECQFRLPKDKKLYKSLLSYSVWDVFGGLATVSQGQGVSIVLNIFFGPVVNAARAIAYQIQAASSQFVTNFLTAVRPQIIKNYAEDNIGRMFRLAFYASKYAYLLMLAIVLPIFFEMDYILELWLGKDVPEFTNVFSRIILITCLLQSFHSASLMPYHAIGKIKVGNIVGGTLMILSLPISYFLLRFGAKPYVVFIVILITNSLQQVITWAVVYYYQRFNINELVWKAYLPCIRVTLLIVAVPFLIHKYMDYGLIRFITLFLSSELFLMVLILAIGIDKNERKILNGYIIKRINKNR